MYSGEVYTESEFKTLLSCSKLYSLGGSIENFDTSQLFVKYAFNYFILGLVKNNLNLPLDNLINNCVNKAYSKTYGTAHSSDNSEIARLKSYAFNFINYFITKINLNKCDIILGPTFPTVSSESFSIKLSLDVIFKPKNRKKQLHAVCFYPFINEHLLLNDPTLFLKLDYLDKFAHSSINKNKFSQVNLHIFSVAKFNTYKSKSREHKIYYRHLTPKDVNFMPLEDYAPAIQFAKASTLPIIYCHNTKCMKRKECSHGARRF